MINGKCPQSATERVEIEGGSTVGVVTGREAGSGVKPNYAGLWKTAARDQLHADMQNNQDKLRSPSDVTQYPSRAHKLFDWNTFFTCQNVGLTCVPSSSVVGPRRAYGKYWRTADEATRASYDGVHAEEVLPKRPILKLILDKMCVTNCNQTFCTIQKNFTENTYFTSKLLCSCILI